ncbi:MAG: hypothetical protein KC731_24810 [Myxococcales bacterium]|nr:hypothetical protein [Myxococcales bacterium]
MKLTARRIHIALVSILITVGCSSPPEDGAGGSQADSGTGATSGSSGGVGLPGCQPTLACASSCMDDACIDACTSAASDRGEALFWAFSDCGAGAGCMDLSCSIDACPAEYDACTNDFGENGTICFASGTYGVCKLDGECETRDAKGGAWGTTEAVAREAALVDCTSHMNSLITLQELNFNTAGVVESCEVYECTPQ